MIISVSIFNYYTINFLINMTTDGILLLLWNFIHALPKLHYFFIQTINLLLDHIFLPFDDAIKLNEHALFRLSYLIYLFLY